MPDHDHPTALRRARRSFWILVVVSVLAAGALSDALRDDPAPSTGLRVAASSLVLVVSVALASRVLLALDHARADREPPRPPGRRARALRGPTTGADDLPGETAAPGPRALPGLSHFRGRPRGSP